MGCCASATACEPALERSASTEVEATPARPVVVAVLASDSDSEHSPSHGEQTGKAVGDPARSTSSSLLTRAEHSTSCREDIGRVVESPARSTASSASLSEAEDNPFFEDDAAKAVEGPTRSTTSPTRSTASNADGHSGSDIDEPTNDNDSEDNPCREDESTNAADSAGGHTDRSTAGQHRVPVLPDALTFGVDYDALRGAGYEQRRATVRSAHAAAAAREGQRREREDPASSAYGRGVHEEGKHSISVYDSRRRTVQFAVDAAVEREARITDGAADELDGISEEISNNSFA